MVNLKFTVECKYNKRIRTMNLFIDMKEWWMWSPAYMINDILHHERNWITIGDMRKIMQEKSNTSMPLLYTQATSNAFLYTYLHMHVCEKFSPDLTVWQELQMTEILFLF